MTESEIDDDEISNNETSNIPRTITQDNVLERSDEIDSKEEVEVEEERERRERERGRRGRRRRGRREREREK